MTLKFLGLLLFGVLPPGLALFLLTSNWTRNRTLDRNGIRSVGRVVEIRAVKTGRSWTVSPVVEVTLPDGKRIAVSTGEQNIFTHYSVDQHVPVVLLQVGSLLMVHINTPQERLPPLLIVVCALLLLTAVLAIKIIAS